MKKIFCIVLLFLLIITDAQVISTGTPQAMKATSGIGLHKNRIWWVNWDLNNNTVAGDNLVNGAQTTFNSPAGFTYKVTISNVRVFTSSGTEITSGTNRVLVSALTTSWFGNNMPTAYAGFPTSPIIALNQKNELASGGPGDGNRVTFRLTVEATDPSGNIGNATGIVIGGSESLGSTNEWYTLTTPSGRVRLIDKYIRNSDWTNYAVQ